MIKAIQIKLEVKNERDQLALYSLVELDIPTTPKKLTAALNYIKLTFLAIQKLAGEKSNGHGSR